MLTLFDKDSLQLSLWDEAAEKWWKAAVVDMNARTKGKNPDLVDALRDEWGAAVEGRWGLAVVNLDGVPEVVRRLQEEAGGLDQGGDHDVPRKTGGHEEL